MIEKNEIRDWGWDVDCDRCPYYENFPDIINFSDLIAELKRQGWKIRKNQDGEWEHICPSCAEGK